MGCRIFYMAKLDITKYSDEELSKLVEARWKSSETLWEIIQRVTVDNQAAYENRSQWLGTIPERRRKFQVQANRIFPNMESVINSLIANPPGINVLPAREGQAAKEFARKLENYFRKRYTDLNTKETMRMGLRNLYFSRLIVIKPFWNPLLGQGGDFDFRAVDPNKVRFGKYARKEQDSEFAIEEIEDNLCAVVQRFPEKKQVLMSRYGYVGEDGERRMYIENPDVKYKESWIDEWVIFKLNDAQIILDKIKNPYWDWDGILITDEEEQQLATLEGESRRNYIQGIKLEQDSRRAIVNPPAVQEQAQPGLIERGVNAVGNAIKSFIQPQDIQVEQPTEEVPEGEIQPSEGATEPAPMLTADQLKPYFFNYFDQPRKPYIFATIFNNENSPIGRTDMITLSMELQRGIDKRKMDIDENAELVNGMLKVDASVMGKSDAQRIRFETKGIIWGKGVKEGVSREMGTPLPEFVHQDMIDSRGEIDNIMAASSAFRGEREGQETKAGRLALIQQSYLRLNELVQVVDFTYHEMFSWGMQLAKTRYTEYHYAKWMGKEGAREVIELIQDDFETGSEVTIIAGKTLPVDDEFKFEQAQNDVEKGYISPVDYLDIAQYDNSKELSKNAVKYKINPIVATGITPEEASQIAPPAAPEEKAPSVSIAYKDVQPDGQVQILEKIGVHVNPEITVAEKQKQHEKEDKEFELKKQAQEHGQRMAEDGNLLKVGEQSIKREGIQAKSKDKVKTT